MARLMHFRPVLRPPLAVAMQAFSDGSLHMPAVGCLSSRQFSSAFEKRKERPVLNGVVRDCRPFQQHRSFSLQSTVHAVSEVYLWAHQTTGLPWWAIICGGAVAIRLPVYCMLPLVHRMQIRRFRATKFIELDRNRVMSQISLLKLPPKKADQETSRAMLKLYREVFRKHKCQIWKMFFHIPVLIPIWIMNNFAIRELIVNCEVDLQCTLLAVQGPLFCTNLLIPHLSFSVLTCLSILWLIELHQIKFLKFPKDPPLPGVKPPLPERIFPYWLAFSRISATGLVFFYFNFPGALMLSVLAGNASMSAMQTLMEVPAVRRTLRIEPSPLESHTFALDIKNHFKTMWQNIVEMEKKEREVSAKRQADRKQRLGRLRRWLESDK